MYFRHDFTLSAIQPFSKSIFSLGNPSGTL